MESGLKWVTAICTVLTLVFGGGWYKAYSDTRQAQIAAQRTVINTELKPILVMLAQNRDIRNELYGAPYHEIGWGIQESYLRKARRDGAKANAVMRAKIDDLVMNNDKMIALVEMHLPTVETVDFKQQSEAFIRHAKRYGDRWRALPEVLESGGLFPVAEPVFPKGFQKSVEDEIAAIEKQID